MLLATLIVGCVTAYWFGLRPGAWAAAGALVLLIVAANRPELAMSIYAALAVAVVAGLADRLAPRAPHRRRPGHPLGPRHSQPGRHPAARPGPIR
jgi:hypothetical protein